VELVGELCVYSAPSLDVHLQVLIAFGRTEVALDASRLELLGAAGVRVLVENSHRCAAGGGRLRISAASPHVCRVLSVCELTERFGLGARDPDAPVLGPSRLRRGFADVRRAS
jgi:anti-anti-sigma factor